MELSRTCLLGGASILGDITQRDRDFMVFQKGSENALGLGEKKKKNLSSNLGCHLATCDFVY